MELHHSAFWPSIWEPSMKQIANGWLLLLYIGDFLTFSSPPKYAIFLRTVLAGGALFFTLWAIWVLCAPDTALWNFIFFIYNMVRLVMVLYTDFINPTVDKPRFEKLFNAVYRGSGLSVGTYNKLIDGGTVKSLPKTQSLLLHKNIYHPDKIVQIISGKILINLLNGSKVRMRDGDIINHDNWNWNVKTKTKTTLVANYTTLTETLVITWSYGRLSELLKGQDRRLFSYLLLHNLNSLLLHLTDVIDQNSIYLSLAPSDSSNSSSDQNFLLQDQTSTPTSSDSTQSGRDSGIGNTGCTADTAVLLPQVKKDNYVALGQIDIIELETGF